MIKRVLIVGAIALVLIALVAYSQTRPTPRKVSGFIESDEIRLGSRVGGRVAKVHVEEGQQVAQHDVLVELEPFDLLQRESEARANLQALESEYDRLKAGYRPEEIAQAKAQYEELQADLELLQQGPRRQEIDAARARLESAHAGSQLAQQNHKRVLSIFNMGATTREELDRVTERLKEAQQNVVVRQNELDLLLAGARAEELAAARARLEKSKQAWELAKKGYRPEEIARAKAARDAAQAALDAVGAQMKELTIRAPADGVIESLELQKGDLVAAGAPVLSMMDVGRMWVRAYVPQNRFALKVGQRLRVEVDGLPGEAFLGEVVFISRQAEFTPSNVQTAEERAKQVFRIKVELQQGLDRLRPGMAADVWLDLVDEAR